MRPRLAPIAALALAAVLLASCGSEGSDAEREETTTTVAEESSETTEAGDAEAPATDVTEEEYVAALTENLSSGSEESGQLVLDEGAAECIAPRWVEAMTVELLQERGVTTEALSDPSFDGESLGMELAQGEAMVAAFGACDVDVVALFAAALTQGLEPAQQACVAENADPALVEALLATSFSTGDSDAEFEAVLAQLESVCELPDAG
jgi:sirohydrochlorin ferrochelatase